jgi:hypothetical protein
MTAQVRQEYITRALLEALDETFEAHHGIYLDEGTSLFDTLAVITAAQASVPVGSNCATLAAQVAHVTFSLEVLEAGILQRHIGDVDWGEIWRRISAVSDAEWQDLVTRLRQTYHRIYALLTDWPDWDAEHPISGALAIVVHSAYHLGEIRQALCTLRG